MPLALGLIEIQRVQGETGPTHTALAWPSRVALCLDPVLNKDPHQVARRVKRGDDVRVYYCNRNEPGIVHCGKLRKAGRRLGFAIDESCLATEHPSFQATLGATDVFGAVIQLATNNFTEWQALGSEVLDEMDGKTWASTPRAFIDANMPPKGEA